MTSSHRGGEGVPPKGNQGRDPVFVFSTFDIWCENFKSSPKWYLQGVSSLLKGLLSYRLRGEEGKTMEFRVTSFIGDPF